MKKKRDIKCTYRRKSKKFVICDYSEMLNGYENLWGILKIDAEKIIGKKKIVILEELVLKYFLENEKELLKIKDEKKEETE